jgi:hypothetical protein
MQFWIKTDLTLSFAVRITAPAAALKRGATYLKPMKKELYRMLEDGEEFWRGPAYGVDHAEERAFFDESPGSIPRYTLERWGRVKYSKQLTGKGWVTVYKNEFLAPS